MDTSRKPYFLFLYIASHCKMKGLLLLYRAKVFLFHLRKCCFSWEWTVIVDTMLLCQGKIMEVTSLLTIFFAMLMFAYRAKGEVKQKRASEQLYIGIFINMKKKI